MSEHTSHLPVGYSAYANSKCRCDGCRAAWADYCRDLRQGRRENPHLHPAPHGTDSAYLNYGCRCPECREAHRMSNRRRRGAWPTVEELTR